MEAQPRFSILFVISAVPILAAVGWGHWLSGSGSSAGPEAVARESQRQRTEEVVAQDRLLVDALWSSIETLRARTQALAQIRQVKPDQLPEGAILHWAEFEVREGKLTRAIQSARNSGFAPAAGAEAFETYYLQAALTRLDLHELDANGATLLRIKQEQGRGAEWIAFAFRSINGRADSSVLLALVQPSDAFPIFRRWTARSEGGNLRGYLVGSDGFVLAHSQHPYEASDFAATQVFQAGARELLAGRMRSGAGTYKAIDQVSVTAAFARPGTLPVAAVVERVNPREPDGATVLASSGATVLGAISGAVGLATLLALGLSQALGLATRRRGRNASTGVALEPALAAADATEDSAADFFAELNTASDARGRVPVGASASGSPIPSVDPNAARRAIERFETEASQAHELPPGADVETDLERELLSPAAQEPSFVATREGRRVLAELDERAKAVPGPRDARAIAGELAELAARLTDSPAMYFAYRPSLRACMCESESGLPAGSSIAGLSFRLTDSILARIARYEKTGRLASVADDPNLALLMAKRFGGSRCEAWPVTGADGKLLGVLAVLGAAQGLPRVESWGEMIRSSGQRMSEASHV